MIFSTVQIKHMQDTVSDWWAKDSILWKNAFTIYNGKNKPQLSMAWQTSYRKVLAYIIANNSKETVNIG